MSYLGVNPQLRAYKDAEFIAVGGETTIPIRCDMETLVIKNGVFLIPRRDFYIDRNQMISLSAAASAGDEYYIIDISTFCFSNMVTHREMEDALDTNARPLFEVVWWPSRISIPSGLVPADGQELSRSLYADAFTGIGAGMVPMVNDEEWLSTPAKRASYTLGDGSTTFRVPDYNGKSQDGSAAVVLRGDGLNADPIGDIQGDAMRVIEGHTSAFFRAAAVGDFGALKTQVYGPTPPMPGTPGAHQGDSVIIRFSNKDVVPTAPENRMVNTAGVWCIRLFNGTVFAGRANAAQLATEVGKLSSEVNQLQTKLDGKAQVTLFEGILPAEGIVDIIDLSGFETITVTGSSTTLGKRHYFSTTIPTSQINKDGRYLVMNYMGVDINDRVTGWIDFPSNTQAKGIGLWGSSNWSDVCIRTIQGYR